MCSETYTQPSPSCSMVSLCAQRPIPSPSCSVVSLCAQRPIPSPSCSMVSLCALRPIPSPSCSVVSLCAQRPIPSPSCSMVSLCAQRPIPSPSCSMVSLCAQRPIPIICYPTIIMYVPPLPVGSFPGGSSPVFVPVSYPTNIFPLPSPLPAQSVSGLSTVLAHPHSLLS